MKKTITILAAVSFILCFTSDASFAQNCADEQDMVSITQCHENRYIKAEKELNDIYKQAMKSLPENEKLKLRQAQREWLKFRDASIDFVVEQNKETRSYGRIVIADYRASVVEKRILELKHLLSGPE